MIESFEVRMVGGFYLLVAIMLDGPPIQVGLFGNVEDIDRACAQFRQEHKPSLH